MLAPDPTQESSPRFDLVFDVLSAAVLGTVIVLIGLTWRDYGITWDETWHVNYGDYILSWWTTLGEDTSALSYRDDYLYGGGFDFTGALFRRLVPQMSDFDAIHLWGATLGVLGLAGAWRLGRQLGGPFAGFASVAMLSLTPVYYGHMFNNPKDLPFAVGYIWGMHFLCLAVRQLPCVPRRLWISVALVLGLAISVRIAGLLLLCYLLAAIGFVALERWIRTKSMGAGMPLLRPWKYAVAVIAGAWTVMVLFWPWALHAPLQRPFIALGRMSRYTHHERMMPFAGEQVSTLDPQWDYLFHYFTFKLPLSVIVLAFVGLAFAVISLRPSMRYRVPPREFHVWGMMAMGIVLPPAYAILAGSVVYDGLRHFLFLVPPIVVVAGLAVAAIARLLWKKSAVAASSFLVLWIAVVGRQAITMHDLHPHQYIYFNELLGGLPGALDNYDTDYYGNTYKEGFETLYDKLWEEDPESFVNTTYVVTGCIPDFIARRYLAPNFDLKDEDRPPFRHPEFYLGYTRSDCDKRHRRDPIMFSVQRQETPLNVVRDMRDSAHKKRAKERRARAKERRERKRREELKEKKARKRPRQPSTPKLGAPSQTKQAPDGVGVATGKPSRSG